MSVRRRRRSIERLRKVLDDWLKEDLSDSSDSDINYKIGEGRSKSKMTNTMETKKRDSDASSCSSTTTEQQQAGSRPSSSVEEERTSSRLSEERTSSRLSNASSTGTDHLPPPPKYDSLVEKAPVKENLKHDQDWDDNIDKIVDEFDKKCQRAMRDHQDFSNFPSTRKQSLGVRRFTSEETSRKGANTPPRATSSTGYNSERDMSSWNRDLLSNDDFFSDRLRNRRASPFDRPFGFTSRFGGDLDRFFGRRDNEWDTFFPDIKFSDFGHVSSLRGRRNSDKSRELPITKSSAKDFEVEVDVQGYDPNELLVKTVGQKLIVSAKTELASGGPNIANNKHEFRELRREFTIPNHVNPHDVKSVLTPDGKLVLQAPSSEKLSIACDDKPTGL